MIGDKGILLTNGAGFIATKLCELLSDNNEIRLYASLNRNKRNL